MGLQKHCGAKILRKILQIYSEVGDHIQIFQNIRRVTGVADTNILSPGINLRNFTVNTLEEIHWGIMVVGGMETLPQ